MKDLNDEELEIVEEIDPLGDVTTPFDSVFKGSENGVSSPNEKKGDNNEVEIDTDVRDKCEKFLERLNDTFNNLKDVNSENEIVSLNNESSNVSIILDESDSLNDESLLSENKNNTQPTINESLSSEKTPAKTSTTELRKARLFQEKKISKDSTNDLQKESFLGEKNPTKDSTNDLREENSVEDSTNELKETSPTGSVNVTKASRAESPASDVSEASEKEEIVLDDSETSETESEYEESESEEDDSAEALEKWKIRNNVEYSEKEDKYYKNNGKMYQKQIEGKMTSCSTCCKTISHHFMSEIFTHPVLGVLMCKKCAKFYGKGTFKKDAEGYDEYCRWCANGGDLLMCDHCTNGFCKNCIKRNLGRSALKEVMDSKKWKCYVCSLKPLIEARCLHRTILKGIRRTFNKKIEKSLNKEKNSAKKMKKKAKCNEDKNAKQKLKKRKRNISQDETNKEGTNHGEDLQVLLTVFSNQLMDIKKRTKGKNNEEAKIKFNRRILRLIDLMQVNFTKVRKEIVQEYGDIVEDNLNKIDKTDDKHEARSINKNKYNDNASGESEEIEKSLDKSEKKLDGEDNDRADEDEERPREEDSDKSAEEDRRVNEDRLKKATSSSNVKTKIDKSKSKRKLSFKEDNIIRKKSKIQKDKGESENEDSVQNRTSEEVTPVTKAKNRSANLVSKAISKKKLKGKRSEENTKEDENSDDDDSEKSSCNSSTLTTTSPKGKQRRTSVTNKEKTPSPSSDKRRTRQTDPEISIIQAEKGKGRKSEKEESKNESDESDVESLFNINESSEDETKEEIEGKNKRKIGNVDEEQKEKNKRKISKGTPKSKNKEDKGIKTPRSTRSQESSSKEKKGKPSGRKSDKNPQIIKIDTDSDSVESETPNNTSSKRRKSDSNRKLKTLKIKIDNLFNKNTSLEEKKENSKKGNNRKTRSLSSKDIKLRKTPMVRLKKEAFSRGTKRPKSAKK